MNYKITASEPNGDTLNTTIEFTYDGELREVIVSHFQPKSFQEIEVGIQNRILSEIKAIDSAKITSTINIELNVDNEIKFIPSEVAAENPLKNYTLEELKNQIVLLSNEYNVIMEQRNTIDSQLQDNSAKYDLLIEELSNRV